ncbi:ABC transporter permease [Bacillus sp. SM2101]|uniref:ABC transporter permease n=1 Tax=Bacillus sp. SM2101 TaxID=2805366 RepID=UPI001BDDDE09|nr:ABC transporter permease [Bacillus sp. SM2101]
MNEAKKIWNQRFAQHRKETGRYLRYIFNQHLAFVLIFSIGAGAYYYQQWLETLSPHFPYAIVMSIILAVVITKSPIQTFLKQADIVFLLPMETKMSTYFYRSFLYSFTLQSYIVILVVAGLAPLYLTMSGRGATSLLLLLVLLLILKVWNMLIEWAVQYFVEKEVHIVDFIIRFLISFSFVYFVIIKANYLYPVLIIVIMFGLYFYFRKLTSSKRLKWDHLIELESKRMMTFYRIANLFTDVPQLKIQVKRRKWLDWTLKRLPFSQDATFTHLFARAFLRSSDYFGLFIRLLIIGILLLVMLPLSYGMLVIVVLFLYLTGFQLMTLWRHFSMKIWLGLYPIQKAVREKAFLQLLHILLIIQASIFAIVILFIGKVFIAFLAFVCGIVFSYVFINLYVKSRLKKL